MKLFIYEHITSGALIDESLPASLAREGDNMLMAIVQDLVQLATIELIILRDARLEALTDLSDNGTVHIVTIDNSTRFERAYLDAINQADMVLPIAPETEGVLTEIQQQVLNSQTRLLASHPVATQITSDKYLCHQQLIAHGIHSPTTIKACEWPLKHFHSPSGFIIKPIDGAGCIDTFFIADSPSLEAWLESHDSGLDKMIIQAYIDGEPMSISLLADSNDSLILAINRQKIQFNNTQLTFVGSIVNGVDEADLSVTQAAEIVAKVHQAIVGLWGFIGIDIIVQNNTLFVLDINPRLTSSYSGLRQSLNHNPAQLLFTMMEHGLSALPASLQRQAVEVKV